MARRGNPRKGTESLATSCVTPAEKPTRGTEGKQGHAQYNKNNKNKNLHKMTKKNIIKKGCTLSPLQQQDGQVPQPAEGKVLEPCGSEDQELIASPPPPELIRKR